MTDRCRYCNKFMKRDRQYLFFCNEECACAWENMNGEGYYDEKFGNLYCSGDEVCRSGWYSMETEEFFNQILDIVFAEKEKA